MNISEISMRKLEDKGMLKAVVSVTFEDNFIINNIRILENSNDPSKLFVKFPTTRVGNGKETILFDIIDKELRKDFIVTLLRIYNDEKDKVGYKFSVVQ